MASAAIEYAAQAAALHGGLLAQAAGASASPGYLASARDVRLGAWRLDDLPAAESDALRIVAERQAGDAGGCSTPFASSTRAARSLPALAVAGRRSSAGTAASPRTMSTEPTLGRRALVTGASGGIGQAIAERLARDGAHVIVHANTRLDAAEAIAARSSPAAAAPRRSPST